MTSTHKKLLSTVVGTSRSYVIKRINLERLKKYINRIEKGNGKSNR